MVFRCRSTLLLNHYSSSVYDTSLSDKTKLRGTAVPQGIASVAYISADTMSTNEHKILMVLI